MITEGPTRDSQIRMITGAMGGGCTVLAGQARQCTGGQCLGCHGFRGPVGRAVGPAGGVGRGRRRPHGLGEGHRGDARVGRELPDHFRRRLPRRQALRHAARRNVRPLFRPDPADYHTVRTVFVIGPDKKVKLILGYPMTTGRNFDEVLRVIDSLQLTANHKVATPVNWQLGEDVIIAGSVSDEEAWQRYPEGWRSPKLYIRTVPQPS